LAVDPALGGVDDGGAILTAALVALDLAGGLGIAVIQLGHDGADVLLVIAGPWLLAQQLRDAVSEGEAKMRMRRRPKPAPHSTAY
jgi:hypothetical protein